MVKDKNSLNVLLVDLFNQMAVLQEASIKKNNIDLTPKEILTIEIIYNLDKPTMSNIAKKLEITLGTLTTNIKKLEHKGYVVRYKDKIDARIVKVQLLDRSMEVLRLHYAFHEELVNSVLGVLTTEEEIVLLKSLLKIKNHLIGGY